MLSKEYMRCESGNRQSPINITMPHHGKHQQKLVFHYQASQLHELNNGHTIQVSHVSGCRVDLNDRKYKLRQFHFHAPSEHHIEGKARAHNGSRSKIPSTSPNKTLINSSTSLAKTPAPFNPSAIVTSTRIRTRSTNLSYGFGWVSLFL